MIKKMPITFLKLNLLALLFAGSSAFAQLTLGQKLGDQALHLITELDAGTQVGVVFDAKGQLLNLRAWKPHRKDIFNETGRDIGLLVVPFNVGVAVDGTYRVHIAPLGWHNADLDAKLDGANVRSGRRIQHSNSGTLFKKLEVLTFTVDDRYSYSNLKTQTLEMINVELTNPGALNQARTTFLSVLVDWALGVENTNYRTADGKWHEFGSNIGPYFGNTIGVTDGEPPVTQDVFNGLIDMKFGVGAEFTRITKSGLQFKLSSVAYLRAGDVGAFMDPIITAENQKLLDQYNAAEAQYQIDIKNYQIPPGNNGISYSSNPSQRTTAMPVAPTPPTYAHDNVLAARTTIGLHNEISLRKRVNARAITHRAILMGLKAEYNPLFEDEIESKTTILDLKKDYRSGFKLSLTLNW